MNYTVAVAPLKDRRKEVMQPNNIVTVEVAVKSRLFTHSFAISTNLLGNSHEFLYESHHVKVELPKLSDIQGDDTPYVRVYKGYDAGTVFVKNIDVVLSTNQKVRVPEKSLNMFSERDVYFWLFGNSREGVHI